jgi:hypothetical protein
MAGDEYRALVRYSLSAKGGIGLATNNTYATKPAALMAGSTTPKPLDFTACRLHNSLEKASHQTFFGIDRCQLGIDQAIEAITRSPSDRGSNLLRIIYIQDIVHVAYELWQLLDRLVD